MKAKIDFEIIQLKTGDLDRFVELVKLLNTVFEETNDIGSSKQLNRLLGKSDFHAIAVIENKQIIGGLTAYELERYYTDKSELYIYDIAIKKERQKQGIGKALIEFVKDHSTKNDLEAIFVQAHSDDEPAVRFYEATIGKGEKVDNFIIDL